MSIKQKLKLNDKKYNYHVAGPNTNSPSHYYVSLEPRAKQYGIY